MRKSQRKVFQNLKKKFDGIQKDISSFKSEADEEQYKKIENAILTIQRELEVLEVTLEGTEKRDHDEWKDKLKGAMKDLENASNENLRRSGLFQDDAQNQEEKTEVKKNKKSNEDRQKKNGKQLKILVDKASRSPG